MIDRKDKINLIIAGEETSIFKEEIDSIEKGMSIDMNINIIYSQNQYSNTYYNIINKDLNYFNIIAVNFKTQIEALRFFDEFNQNYKKTHITNSAFPFFLINKNLYRKNDLFNEIKKINSKRADSNKYNSKDIIEYDSESLPKKIIGIYNYYYQIQEERIQQKTLNIMVCGKKGTGKTYLINELLFENRALSKDFNYTSKITSYEHKLFPIVFYDFPGFTNNEDKGMAVTTNYISKFNEEYQNMKNKIHIIFYMIPNDNSRVLQDKEIELIQNLLKTNIPIFFITNRVESNNLKTFKRNAEERMKLIKSSNYTLQELMSHLFILDSTNKSIKNLLNGVLNELNKSKSANDIIIRELSDKMYMDDSKSGLDNRNDNINSSFVIIDSAFDEHKEEIKRNIILDQMKKSIFFNDYSKTFKNVQNKINEIIEKIQNDSNTHLIPLLTAKKDLIKLFNELKSEFKEFLSEEKMKENFPSLNDISEIDLDDNSIGLIIDAIICFSFVFFVGSTGALSLAFGLPIYLITGNKKKKKIEDLLKKNADNMFKRFKSIAIEDNSIKKIAEEYNNIIEKFVKFSLFFEKEHENDIDLLK